MLRRFPAAALATLLAGCGDAPDTLVDTARTHAAIVGGELSPYGTNDDAVLLLRTEVDGRELVCSAALVAPNLALTARHCVSHLVEGAFSCTVRGELESIDVDAGRLGLHLPAESLEFHTGAADERVLVAHGREVLSTLSDHICLSDLAFVVLDQAVDLPLLPLRLDGRALIREEVTLVGYGVDDAMYELAGVTASDLERNRRTDLVIYDVGPEAVEDVTSAPPRTIVLSGPSGCLGDSGGPLLARDTRAVLGVYSVLGGASCLQPNVRHWFTHVPSFKLLIRDAFEAAGAEPVLEEATGAAGAAGAGEGGAGGATEPAAGAGGRAADAGGAGGAELQGGAPGETAGSPGASGEGGAEPPETRPKRSSGCSLPPSPARERSWAAAVALGVLALASLRRRQWRPSSGSASG